jgi:hypothetical protein
MPTVHLAPDTHALRPLTAILSDAPASVRRAESPDDPNFEARYVQQSTIGEGGMGIMRLCADRHIGRG